MVIHLFRNRQICTNTQINQQNYLAIKNKNTNVKITIDGESVHHDTWYKQTIFMSTHLTFSVLNPLVIQMKLLAFLQ
jgi:hypothetical protein